METIGKKSCLTLCAVLTFVLFSNSAFCEVQENQANDILVGRIAYIEGQLLRYMPEEDDWVLTDVDTPFGQYDNLFSSEDGKAEIIMPNNTLLRISGDTQVQLIELTNEVTEINVSSGTARLYNKSTSTEIKATTPFGDVIMPPDSVCDIYVQETQTEVVSLKGSLEFIKTGSTTRQEVIAGSSSIIVNAEQIIASAERVVPAWNSWNVARDAQWTQRMQARGESTKYLPENLHYNAVELDDNGRWEQVNYEGAYNYYWRPSHVSVDWTPFSSGRWIVWHGDHTWVPCEPFGYVTHHYGNWVYVGNYWYWAPPVSAVMVSSGLPLLYVGSNWNPGRVAWVSSDASIGWIPLAPFETYYCYNYWGPWSQVRHYNHYYDCHKYRHYQHARFIDHHRFYGSKNYQHEGLRKGYHNEKFRGTASVPPAIRKDFKNQNKHLSASNMPGFRDTVKKIDVRRDKRTRQVAGNSLHATPFKRTVAEGVENNRRAGKPIAENTSKKFIKNNKQQQQRLESANKGLPGVREENRGKRNRDVTATMETRKEIPRPTPRSFEQPSERMKENRRNNQEEVKKPVEPSFKTTPYNRRTLQEYVPRMQATTRQNFDTAGQGSSNRTINEQNTGSDMRVQSHRSGEASRESFSNTHSGIGTDYTGSAGQQRVQQNSTGSVQQNSTGSVQQNSSGGMQGYSGRGR